MDQDNMNIIDWSDLGMDASSEFRPEPYYDVESDCFTLFISDAESKRQRVDRYLTVYRSIKTNEVTGCHIKDVHKVLQTAEAFQIDINTGHMTLGLLLLAIPWTELQERDDEIQIHARTYREVIHAAGRTRIALPCFGGEKCAC